MESSLSLPKQTQFKETKTFGGAGETIAFNACQASAEIQTKTNYCERGKEIKGAFITLGTYLSIVQHRPSVSWHREAAEELLVISSHRPSGRQSHLYRNAYLVERELRSRLELSSAGRFMHVWQ